MDPHLTEQEDGMAGIRMHDHRCGRTGIFRLLLLAGLLTMMWACAVQHPLTIADIEPKLANFDIAYEYGIGGEDGIITYYSIGNDDFDAFFKTAAKLDGLIILTHYMTMTATGQLKKYAMSAAANEALKDNIHELVGDTPPEEYSTEQSIAVMQLAKQQDKVSDEERKYFATTSLSLGVGVYSLTKGVIETGNLLRDGSNLLQNIGLLEPWKIPAATKAISASMTNLKSIRNNAPATLEEMKVLYEGFKALNGD